MCHPGQLLKVGKRVVKCGLIVNSVNYSLWTLDLKLLENFQKPLNPTLSQFSDQGFCNTWLVTKMKFNLSAKSKARHLSWYFVGLKSFRIPSAVKVGSHNIIVLIIACSLVIGSPKCQQGGALARSNLCPAQRAVSMLKSPAGVCVQVRNGHHDCSGDCPLSLRAESLWMMGY